MYILHELQFIVLICQYCKILPDDCTRNCTGLVCRWARHDPRRPPVRLQCFLFICVSSRLGSLALHIRSLTGRTEKSTRPPVRGRFGFTFPRDVLLRLKLTMTVTGQIKRASLQVTVAAAWRNPPAARRPRGSGGPGR